MHYIEYKKKTTIKRLPCIVLSSCYELLLFFKLNTIDYLYSKRTNVALFLKINFKMRTLIILYTTIKKIRFTKHNIKKKIVKKPNHVLKLILFRSNYNKSNIKHHNTLCQSIHAH